MADNKPKKYHDPARWRIEGEGGEVIGWAWEAGPFKMTTSTTEVPDGPGMIRDVPATTKMAQFTITAPLHSNKSLYNLFKMQMDATTGRGTIEEDLYVDLDFIQMDRDESDLEVFRVFNCCAIDYEADSFNKKGTDKRTEKITFTGSYFDRFDA